MIHCYNGDMFSVKADWYAIPTNFKGSVDPFFQNRFPSAFNVCVEFCSMGFMETGIVLTVHNDEDKVNNVKRNLIFYPVSDNIVIDKEVLKSSLNRIVEIYKERNITSIVFPKIGGIESNNINNMIVNAFAHIKELEVYISR